MRGVEFGKRILQNGGTAVVSRGEGKEVAGGLGAVGSDEAPIMGEAHNSSSWKDDESCRCLPPTVWTRREKETLATPFSTCQHRPLLQFVPSFPFSKTKSSLVFSFFLLRVPPKA